MYLDVPQIKLEEPQSIKTTFLEVYKEDTPSILSTYALYPKHFQTFLSYYETKTPHLKHFT